MDTIVSDILETIVLMVILVTVFSLLFTYLLFGVKKKCDKNYGETYKNSKNINNNIIK